MAAATHARSGIRRCKCRARLSGQRRRPGSAGGITKTESKLSYRVYPGVTVTVRRPGRRVERIITLITSRHSLPPAEKFKKKRGMDLGRISAVSPLST